MKNLSKKEFKTLKEQAINDARATGFSRNELILLSKILNLAGNGMHKQASKVAWTEAHVGIREAVPPTILNRLITAKESK